MLLKVAESGLTFLIVQQRYQRLQVDSWILDVEVRVPATSKLATSLQSPSVSQRWRRHETRPGGGVYMLGVPVVDLLDSANGMVCSEEEPLLS